MDINFHINKIIDNGSKVNDWVEFINDIHHKCKMETLLHIYTVALNNIDNNERKRCSKSYKMLMVRLGNLQSTTSPELARRTFNNAYNLDMDCAVVCVYFAQFEFRHSEHTATNILLRGKRDGRTPKILIKNAYYNILNGQADLFNGFDNPWDESLNDLNTASTNLILSAVDPSPKSRDRPSLHTSRSLSKIAPRRMPSRSSSKTQSTSCSGIARTTKGPSLSPFLLKDSSPIFKRPAMNNITNTTTSFFDYSKFYEKVSATKQCVFQEHMEKINLEMSSLFDDLTNHTQQVFETPSPQNISTNAADKIDYVSLLPSRLSQCSDIQPPSSDTVDYKTTMTQDAASKTKPAHVPLVSEIACDKPAIILNSRVDSVTQQDECLNDTASQSCKDVNNQVRNGLRHLGSIGYNLSTDMKPVQRSNHFVVNGKIYSRVASLAKGGSCMVYKVCDTDGNSLALKLVKLWNLDDFVIESYINEIKWLEKMNGNPCIIQLVEWERTSERLMIVLEMGDSDLAHVLRSKKVLTASHTKEIWRQMLSAVEAIHEAGIIHADLKPANFLFVGKKLKLIDFGIANGIQSNKTSVTREYHMGTLDYMPPEAFLCDEGESEGGNKISRRSDVWSLGCILYLMTFGKTPYKHIRYDNVKMLCIQNGTKIEFPDVGDSNLLHCLQACLRHNMRERPSITELLQHPYLRSE